MGRFLVFGSSYLKEPRARVTTASWNTRIGVPYRGSWVDVIIKDVRSLISSPYLS